MVMKMARPAQRLGTKNKQFRQRVPADLLKAVRGRTLIVELPESIEPDSETFAVSVTISAEVIFSLRTSEKRLATVRHAAALRSVEMFFEAERRGPQDLTHVQLMALLGEAYRQLIAEHRETPPAIFRRDGRVVWSEFEVWDEYARKAEEEIAFQTDEARRRAIDTLLPIIDVYGFLSSKAVNLSETSFRAFIDGLPTVIHNVMEALAANAQGNYADNGMENAYPKWSAENPAIGLAKRERQAARSQLPDALSLTGLVDDWWKEAQALGKSESTLESYSNCFRLLSNFLGHDDAARVTQEDVIRYKDHRLTTINEKTKKPVSPKTVKGSDLTAFKSVFDWAVANLKLSSNPASGVTVKLGKRIKVRERDFTDEEAQAILRGANSVDLGPEPARSLETRLAKRWVPWLCAYSGSRLGELIQLRKEDFRQEAGAWIIKVTPEAGTVKNNQYRDVPVHTHLVEMGFMDFVQSAKVGYLFMTIKGDATFRGVWQSKKNRLAEFAREYVKDRNVAPNHGWRHTFKSKGFEAGIQEKVLDAICGHAPANVGRSYGSVSLKTKIDALALFPRFDIDSA
ncbi:tyrosine-type recombinase/integrase [Agrobacterium tumefaciens]|uniref:tyrosine-type recombinase/integrase n=1 Tax=Agrobacterium tumefaciens TaxID=358 RepID=UPI001FA978DB|nr:tyrosine-type recombinase/integrase [Agrobacterium tumefaciens]UNZ50411.1 site-specific integrase [Agrobacterium tumefaciens]